jgi:CIC family chloride channel protein
MLIKKALWSIYISCFNFYISDTFGEGYESIKVLSENNPGKILENTLLAISKIIAGFF